MRCSGEGERFRAVTRISLPSPEPARHGERAGRAGHQEAGLQALRRPLNSHPLSTQPARDHAGVGLSYQSVMAHDPPSQTGEPLKVLGRLFCPARNVGGDAAAGRGK